MKTNTATAGSEPDTQSVAERAKDAAADVLRQAKLVSNEARHLGRVAEDAIQSGREVANDALRAAKRGLRTAADWRDEASHRVKREPIKWMGLAFAAGLCAGLAAERIRGARRAKAEPAGV